MKSQVLRFMMISGLFLGLSVLSVRAQVNDGWAELGNAAYNSQLNSVAFADATTGFAVGSAGACLKTTDGGSTWTAISLNVGYDLKKIVFLNDSVGYIGGGLNYDFAKVLKTTDGGLTWTEVLSVNETYNNMYFLDEDHGWLTSYDLVFLTEDGGDNWSNWTLTNFYDIQQAHFLSPDTGFISPAASSRGLQRTYDGGSTFDTVRNLIVHRMTSTPDGSLYLLSRTINQKIERSTDMGNTWSVCTNGLGSERLYGMFFKNDSLGFVWTSGVYGGKLYRTTDTAQNWTQVYQNPAADLQEMTCTPLGLLVAVGDGGLIMTSTDGLTWDTASLGAIPATLNRVAFLDDLNGVALGDRGVLIRTEDAGLNWNRVSLPLTNKLTALAVVNDTTIYMGGYGPVMMISDDRGASWSMSVSGITGSEVWDIVSTGPLTAYLSTNQGIHKSTDAGNNWGLTSWTNLSYDIFAIDDDTVMVSGNLTFNITDDAGANWTTYSVPTSSVFAMDFRSADHGLTGNGWGRINQTNDGGQNWVQKFNCTSRINEMKHFDDTTVYFVANDGIIGKSEDGGETWFLVESGTIRDLTSIFFSPDGTGYIVGADGYMLKRSLTPIYSIRFDVQDDLGQPLTGVALTLNGAGYPVGTDSIGGLGEGSYQYILSKSGYVSDTGSVQLESDTLLQISLVRYRNLHFITENVYGQPVENASITVGSLLPELTSISGEVFFTGLLPGTTGYQVTALNYLSVNASLNLNGDTSVVIVLEADLDAPLAQPATAVTTTSFTANWDDVAEADSFLLYVSGDHFVTYLPGLDGLSISELFYTVSGLSPALNYEYRLKSKNVYGYSQYSNIVSVSTSTSAEELVQDGNVRIWPNPAGEFIIIQGEGSENLIVRICDYAGKLLLEERIKSAGRVDCSAIPAGIYIMSVSDQDKVHYIKLTIDK